MQRNCRLVDSPGPQKIISVPLDGTSQTFFEAYLRLIPEKLSGACDIGVRVLDVARTRVRINWRDVFSRDFVYLLKHRVDGNPIAARNIENLACHAGHSACEKIRLHDVLHIREVTRLKSVSIDF